MKTKRKLLVWTEADIELVKDFFSEERTKDEKSDICQILNRTWNSVYNKGWELKKYPNGKPKATPKAVVKAVKPAASVTVTHLTQPEVVFTTKIRIGSAVVETQAKSFKVNDVLIEV